MSIQNNSKFIPAKGVAIFDSKAALRPFSFERRAPGEHDVLIEIKYCGICHSDIHKVVVNGVRQFILWFQDMRFPAWLLKLAMA